MEERYKNKIIIIVISVYRLRGQVVRRPPRARKSQYPLLSVESYQGLKEKDTFVVTLPDPWRSRFSGMTD